MTKEYYEAKANLCRDLFIKNAADGNTKEAGDDYLPAEVEGILKVLTELMDEEESNA